MIKTRFGNLVDRLIDVTLIRASYLYTETVLCSTVHLAYKRNLYPTLHVGQRASQVHLPISEEAQKSAPHPYHLVRTNTRQCLHL